MSVCLIGLGSNVGQRQEILQHALKRLQEIPEVELLSTSRWINTLPAGGPAGQEVFLNGAALVRTSLSPELLLSLLKRIELDLGRTAATVRWSPRLIDLDLLLYDDQALATESLILPHPRMAWRRFVLEPAAEIAANMVHPSIGWSIGRLLDHLNTTPYYLAIAGPIGVDKTRLAQALVDRTGAHWIREQPDLAGNALAKEIKFLDQRPIISDFWLVDQTMRARLVVILDAPADEFQAELVDQGPVLRVPNRDSDDFQAVVDEVQGAIEAMR